jgi:hypothetical protein
MDDWRVVVIIPRAPRTPSYAGLGFELLAPRTGTYVGCMFTDYMNLLRVQHTQQHNSLMMTGGRLHPAVLA